MKKSTRIICALFVIIMLASCAVVGVNASSAYQTYTYSISGYALHSPDAYVANSKPIDYLHMGLDTDLVNPRDIVTDDKDNVYIADTGNNRIVCLDRYYKQKFIINGFVNDKGVKDSLKNPEGVFVTKDRIWVCDTGKGRIVVFDREGSFLKIIEAPTSNLFGNNAKFTPIAMVVDQYNRLYIVSRTTNEGVIVMTEDGDFTGFIGAQATTLSVWEVFWRRFYSGLGEETVQTEEENISVEPQNIAIDSQGFIYLITKPDKGKLQGAIQSKDNSDTYMPVKMLNTNGDEIMRRNGFWPPAGEVDFSTLSTDEITGPSTIIDVAVGPEGTWSIIDEDRQRIYTYDSDGSLLFAFGDKGTMIGNLEGVEGLAYQDEKLLVLDNTTRSITVFDRTDYGDILIEALAAENDRDFKLAINKWTEVLKRNSNFDAAYVGIGQAMYLDGKYEESLRYFEAAYDTENWSESYQEIRRIWMSDYFLVLLLIIVAVIAVFLVSSKFITKINKKAMTSGKKKTFIEELLFGFHLIVHPFDGFWDLKHEKRGSIRASIVFIVLAIGTFFYQSIGQGYLMNPEGKYTEIWAQALGVLVPLFLFVVANWCLTTLFEGEGSFKDIFIACSYSLLPLPLLIIPATILSNFCTNSEKDLIGFVSTLAFIWLGLLIVFGTQVTHDYTMGKNIITIAGTIVGMVFIMFLILLFSTLVGKMVGLVTNIITELRYRM